MDSKHSILDNIKDIAETSMFRQIVEQTHFDKKLTKGGTMTVFVPNDKAFSKLPKKKLNMMLKDPDKLQHAIKHHIVNDVILTTDYMVALTQSDKKIIKAPTLDGDDITIETEHGITVDDAHLLDNDIESKNGVFHLIDKVLMPKTMAH